MLVTSYLDRFPEWIGEASGWLADGSLRTTETVVEGLERAPEALMQTLRGDNVGKMLVRLAG
jgi:NADPH-dependent curcumin reductase CurA